MQCQRGQRACRRARGGAAVIALGVTALAAPSHAQDIQNFHAAPGTRNYLGAESTQVPPHLEFIPSVLQHYGNQPLVARRDGEVELTIVEDLATTDVMINLGLFGHADLALTAPIHYVAGDLVEQRGSDGMTLGDLRLRPKVTLLGGDGGFGLAIAAPITLPTGDPDAFVGNDGTTVHPRLIAEVGLVGAALALNAGVRFRPGDSVGNLDVGHEATYAAAARVDLGTRNLVAIGEVFGSVPVSDVGGDSRSTPLEALGGLRWFSSSGPVVTAGLGTGVVGDYGTPAARFMVGLAWHDRRYDTDGDGLLDDVDVCATEAEDHDNYQDQDGCPDPDNDGDGVPDVTDACPMTPEDHDGWEDEDGCFEEDNDADGLLDEDDRCPDDPENFNNWEDGDGCPDEIPDTDGDGLLDPDDLCPKQAEDADDFQDEDGCPDDDNDFDGILDVVDQCPTEPEVVNGVRDDDGCPDQGPTKVKVTHDKIEIEETIFFDRGRASIKPKSFSILDQLALVLKANPHVRKLSIEGHTDDRGRDDANLVLSQARADSVRERLVDAGVDAGRLESVGYGETRPIANNKRKRGRAANRRVEFVIVDQDSGDGIEIIEEGLEIMP